MSDILISYGDSQVKDLVDPNTNLRIVKTTDQGQFKVKNLFKPNQVLVLDTTLINDKEFIEWALINTRLDLIVLVYDKHNLKFDIKALKKQCKHNFQVIDKQGLPKDDIFGILRQIVSGQNRAKVKVLLEESVGLFPLLLKWLIGSYHLLNEDNQKVIREIDERYMRRNTEAIIRNLAFGIKPEQKFIKFTWVFPKATEKKAKVSK